jgi:deoxyribodipyrimidine photo-lyase
MLRAPILSSDPDPLRDMITIVWFRQDLRIADHPALAAVAERGVVVPVFIWAPDEEGDWSPGGASRWWLHHSLVSLAGQFNDLGSRLIVCRGPSLKALKEIVAAVNADRVVWCRRYEPAAIARDRQIKASLIQAGIRAEDFNGSLLHEPWSVATKQGRPYQVFTPFWKACLAADVNREPAASPCRLHAPRKWPANVSIDDLELLPRIPWDKQFHDVWEPGAPAAELKLAAFVRSNLADYKNDRNRLDLDGISRLSPHLHWGELSPRQVWAQTAARASSKSRAAGPVAFLTELGWREFAYHLLYHFPQTANRPLKQQFNKLACSRGKVRLKRWQRGQTGYPIVDAAMRELWATGFMPNRTRMIVASFLAKDLLIRWQSGAKWFWDALVDADLSNNTLGWQWTAGCGADAAPFFRVFNPVKQAEQFDPEGTYIRRWVPELSHMPTPWIFKPWEAPNNVLSAAGVHLGEDYPQPIVDHADARDAALAAFAKIKGS